MQVLFLGNVSNGLLFVSGQGEKQQHVVKRSMQNCESAYDNYCLNNGQCILLVDINEHHCKYDRVCVCVYVQGPWQIMGGIPLKPKFTH